MKNLLTLLVALFSVILSHAQVSMNIHHSDGTVTVIEAADMDSVFFPLNPMNQDVDLTNAGIQSDPMMLIDSVTFSGVDQFLATCYDGILNGNEQYIDCGGPDCIPCGTCDDGVQNEVWAPSLDAFVMEEGVDCGFPCSSPCAPSCTDGIQNGSEEGIDCGGPCEPCPPAACNDGVWNGLEIDVDCGGPDCMPCPLPNCNDNVQNQNETGVDCGGICDDDCPEPTCIDGIQNGFETGIDCGGECPVMCPPENCHDGVQNQGEEWIDCGGPCPNVCPTCDDGVQNGPEAGNDCVIGDYPNYTGGTCPQCP